MTMPRFGKSNPLVTETFVIDRRFFTFNLLAWNQLLWAYRKQTTTRYYGVIPVGRSQEAILHFYGGSVNFRARKKLVEEVLLFAAQKAPWAVLGYNEDLNQLWKKNATDFTSGVDARRAEYFNPAGETPLS